MRYCFTIVVILTLAPLLACSQQPKTLPISEPVAFNDASIYNIIIGKAVVENWQALPLFDIELKVAYELMGTPYVGGTLEANGEEHLVVNLREMDCTTFVENVLAMALCIKNNETDIVLYKKTLTRIRYRNGTIDQYPSRLHYFTDWMLDNQQKGTISIVSQQIGTATFEPSVGFMSANPDKYKALSEHPEFIPVIAQQETEINKAQLLFIPKNEVANVENRINNGDIIAIATNIAGLDIAHVGIAVQHNGRLHMIHASSSEKKVVMTAVPLSDYLAGIKRHTGILVARPIEP